MREEGGRYLCKSPISGVTPKFLYIPGKVEMVGRYVLLNAFY